jgi:hypothetical protein
MRNKELLQRRMQSMDGLLRKLKLSFNEHDIYKSQAILLDILELKNDIDSIIERED